MGKKKRTLGPVFTEKEFGQIIEEWTSMPEWEASKPGQPSQEFRERVNAYLNRAVRGRPRGQSRDNMEQALREWMLYHQGHTYKQIREELYPNTDERREDQIRKRVSRLNKLHRPV